jgi:hypothetical protein
MHFIHRTFLLAAASAAAIVACGGQYSEGSTTTTTAASAPVGGDTIAVIASNRCEREARCDNIGAGKRYVNMEGCLMELRGSEMNELTTTTCPHGVEARALDKCLADVRGQRCDNLPDAFSRINNCARASLCPR